MNSSPNTRPPRLVVARSHGIISADPAAGDGREVRYTSVFLGSAAVDCHCHPAGGHGAGRCGGPFPVPILTPGFWGGADISGAAFGLAYTPVSGFAGGDGSVDAGHAGSDTHTTAAADAQPAAGTSAHCDRGGGRFPAGTNFDSTRCCRTRWALPGWAATAQCPVRHTETTLRDRDASAGRLGSEALDR